MARSKSSARWLREHLTDPYGKQARQEGYRSRAVYKLKEIQTKNHIIKSGMTVVDLGAAPGGWSQFAAQLVGKTGKVIALDMVPMDDVMGVEFVQGDFREQEALNRLLAVLAGEPVDVVISDIAPHLTGIKVIDQTSSIYLAELVLDFARLYLKPSGDLLLKVFQGEGFDALVRELRSSFAVVIPRKPSASRSRSQETYLLARNYHPS